MKRLKVGIALILTSACANSLILPQRPMPPAPISVTETTRPNTLTSARAGLQTERQGLSAQVLAQIAALQADKAAQSPVQRRIDSQLLYAQKAAVGQAFVPGAEFALTTAADGRQLLDVRAAVTDTLLAQVRALGVDVLDADRLHRAIHVQARLDQVEAIASLPTVLFVSPEQPALLSSGSDVRPIRTPRVRNARAKYRDLARIFAAGPVTSQGDAAHRAAAARSTYLTDGTGVTIGVLSDGVTNLAASQAAGELGAVTVLSGQAGSGDEGTAMLEIVHDLAPGARLYFATAFTSATSFANNIRALRAAGCDIIVDDVFYSNESAFQDGQGASVISSGNAGVIAQAVKDVADSGALYFSSAGNGGNLDAGTSGTWEGDFVDGGGVSTPTSLYDSTGRLHSFGPQAWDVVTTSSRFSTTLKWADPLGASSNDYDLFRLDSTGSSVLSWSTNFQTGTQDPYEFVSSGGAGRSGDRLVVVKYSGSDRYLHLDTTRGVLSIATAGETHGHAATSATNSFGVAATPAVSPGPYPGPFITSNRVEAFSSDGPRRIFFTSDGAAITGGNYSSTGGQVLNKPDLTAADGVSTSLSGFSPFYGTSAAAPHAAAIAALAKSFNWSLTASQLRAVLVGGAIDIEAAGVDRDSGSGIVMADTSIQLASAYAAFTDDPLVAGTTGLKAIHITELRHYVDVLRARYALPSYSWTDSALTPGSVLISASHVTELRTGLAEVYAAAGRTAPVYSDSPIAGGAIRAIHLAELRAAISAIY